MSDETESVSPSGGRRSRFSGAMIAWLAVVAVLGGVIGGLIVWATTDTSSSSSADRVCKGSQVAKTGLPSMVKVSASNGSSSGTGSGELIRDGGYILTNDHVISVALGGGSVSVLYTDGHTSQATIVGTDALTDLAVLKAADGFEDLPVISLGKSADVVVGQPVIALGAPLGLESTVTAGIVSALDRHVPVPSANGQLAHLVDALQTDASINPGNSGGALVDCSSHLIGINTAIATAPNSAGVGGGGSVGLGFAIPVDQAFPIAQELIADGKATHPTVGLQVQPIPPSNGQPGSLFVASVTADGAGAKAGIAAGDVITKINGADVSQPDQLTVAELAARTGKDIALTFTRNGASKDVTVSPTNTGP